MDVRARETGEGGALGKQSLCYFPKAHDFPWRMRGKKERGSLGEEVRRPMALL